MEKTKLFLKQISWENIAVDIPNAIETIKSIPPAKYNSNLFRGLAVGFKSLIYAMERDQNSQDVYPLFLKWFQLYVRLQHQIDSNDPRRSKFESKVPVCTSYILASLKYQNNIANYHQNIMEMCLLLFKSAQPLTMQNIANLDIELIAQLWRPVEFVGDYITQRLCLKLIVAVLEHLSVEQRQTKLSEAKLEHDIQKLLLKLSMDPTNFEEVSRELLNLYNMTSSRNSTVFSIYCTKALFGGSEVFKPNNISNFWIDFNYTSKSVSLLCQLNQSEGKQEEFYIKIKIDKIQIENQFDCSVYTIEQAFFSTHVPAQLLSSRVAVFTLPENQLECLKANSDLIDYYNTYSYAESSDVSTPNTIIKYLAEVSLDSPLTPYFENNDEIPRMKTAVLKLHKCDAAQKDSKQNSTRNQNTNLKFGNNPQTNSTPLVPRVELLSNKVNISTKGSGYNTGINTTTTEDTTVFKKPSIPMQFKTKKQAQQLSMKMKTSKNTSDKPPALTNINTWRIKNVNKPQREIINSSSSRKKTDMTPINNLEQQNFSPMPIYKSGRKQVKSGRQIGSKLKRDEISIYTSIQVSSNSFQQFSSVTKRPVEQQNFQRIQQELIEENSIEISVQEMSNDSRSGTNMPNVETIIHKSIDRNNFPLLQPESSANVSCLHSKQSEITENHTISTPLQASVIPIQRSANMNNYTQLSQSLQILEDQKSYANVSQENSNTAYLNQNGSQYRDDENHVTSSQTSDDESQTFPQNISPSRNLSKQNQIVYNKNSSGTILQSSDIDGQNRINTIEDTASGLPKDTSRRFFKYKHFPSIYSTTPTTATAKRKTRKRKANTTESYPKTKSVNLVKPLNYVTDPNLNINEPVSDSGVNGNSRQIKNLINTKNKADFLNQTNESVQEINFISDSSDQDFVQKPRIRRTSKRKTLLKEVQVSNFVPYSIWKIGQKEKNHSESIILSPKSKLQNVITSKTESARPSKDPFDIVKHFGIKNSIIPRNQTNDSPTSSFASDTIPTYYFSESENETEGAKDSCALRNKSQNSLNIEIVRREQPDDMIQSPIPVPFERAEMFSPISSSRESILTPIQMSLASDCLDVLTSSKHPNESNRLLGNRTESYVSPVRFVSPVYEDLDDELPEDPLQCDTSQHPKIYNSLLEEYHKDVPPETTHLSDFKKKNPDLPISPDTRPFLEPQQPEITFDNNNDSEVVQLIPEQLQFVENVLHELTDERTTSSRGSPVSVYSETEFNEQEAYSHQVTIQTHNNVVSSLRKRTHSAQKEEASLAKIPCLTHCSPLRGYDRLLPEFVKKLTNEKDRLLSNIKTKFNEDIFHNFNKTVDAITKAIDYHQNAIIEEQEKLLSSLENLERHHKILQKNQFELERLHDQVIKRKQACDDKTDKIYEIYKEAEEVLISYADVVKKDQWHSFSSSVVNSVNERLRGYLYI